MSRNRTPTYRLHKATGQAIVTLRNPDGTRRDVYLGKWKTKESRAEYARVIGEFESSGTYGLASGRLRSAVTVNRLLVAFLRHAAAHYRHADGTPTSEYANFICSIRPLRKCYGYTLAAEFGPLALKAIREQFVRDGLSRKIINQRIGRIKRIFKWAASEELVPPSVHHGLSAVSGLQVGRTAARETEPVAPVGMDVVAATLPFMPRHVAGLARFQLATGCRPGEACQLRRIDIDASGPVWFFRPPHHKNAHRGKSRVIAIGPKAQAVLSEFPTDDPTEYVFSAARGMAEIRSGKAASRQTPRWPSHLERNRRKRKKAPRKAPAHWYTRNSYSQAVAKAVEKANARRERMAGQGNFDPIEHWHPNQLRHAHATRVRSLFGLEAAQVSLGHARADVTQIYAEANAALAAEVAMKVG